ncbi:MAG: hypothetical protein PVI97_03500 [Candidatus Thiodiazotropha sp.]|jgi:hypothetical protein
MIKNMRGNHGISVKNPLASQNQIDCQVDGAPGGKESSIAQKAHRILRTDKK